MRGRRGHSQLPRRLPHAEASHRRQHGLPHHQPRPPEPTSVGLGSRQSCFHPRGNPGAPWLRVGVQEVQLEPAHRVIASTPSASEPNWIPLVWSLLTENGRWRPVWPELEDASMRPERKADSPVVTFRITYPWGEIYNDRLRRALPQFGLRTMRDPFVEGSDCAGFFVGPDSESLSKARRLIREYEGALQDDPDFDDETEWPGLLDRLEEVRVFEVMQDWKHFDPDRCIPWACLEFNIDVSIRKLADDREGYEVFECTLRSGRRSRKRTVTRRTKRKAK